VPIDLQIHRSAAVAGCRAVHLVLDAVAIAAPVHVAAVPIDLQIHRFAAAGRSLRTIVKPFAPKPPGIRLVGSSDDMPIIRTWN
jgi:hypothetical protein